MTTTFWSRGFLGIISLIIVIFIALVSNKPPDVKWLLIIFGVSLLISNLLGAFTAVLMAFERFAAFGILSCFYGFAFPVLGVVSLHMGFGLLGIGISQLTVSITVTAIGIGYVNWKVLKPITGFNKSEIWQALKTAAPLGITMLLTAVYYKADFVMLSYLRSDIELGYYNSAYTVVNTLLLFATTFSGTLLPRLSNLMASDRENLDRLYRTVFKYLLFIGLGFAFGTLIVAKPLFELVFGSRYLPGAGALTILIWASALIFVNSLQSQLLIAADKKKEMLIITATATFINIALNLFLIPIFGIIGAAVTTVIAELVNGVWSFLILRDHNSSKDLFKVSPKILISALVMIGILLLLPNIHVVFRIFIGAIAYIISLVIVGGFERAELKGIRDIFRIGTV